MKGYTHRAAQGCWINDMRNTALPTEQWPSIIFDEESEEGLISTFDLMQKSGYQAINVFGMLIGRSWKVNLEESVS
ncbi:MAG: hypothetical protein FWF15_09875, partial [Oscillospiraceae bacterium]|nr:hypothetical protein [Oscillospiraceae bacterium]